LAARAHRRDDPWPNRPTPTDVNAEAVPASSSIYSGHRRITAWCPREGTRPRLLSRWNRRTIGVRWLSPAFRLVYCLERDDRPHADPRPLARVKSAAATIGASVAYGQPSSLGVRISLSRRSSRAGVSSRQPARMSSSPGRARSRHGKRCSICSTRQSLGRGGARLCSGRFAALPGVRRAVRHRVVGASASRAGWAAVSTAHRSRGPSTSSGNSSMRGQELFLLEAAPSADATEEWVNASERRGVPHACG